MVFQLKTIPSHLFGQTGKAWIKGCHLRQVFTRHGKRRVDRLRQKMPTFFPKSDQVIGGPQPVTFKHQGHIFAGAGRSLLNLLDLEAEKVPALLLVPLLGRKGLI